MQNRQCRRQSHGLIQQSSPCSDTWLGTFCLHSCGNQPLGVDGWHALCPRNHKQENLWWLNHLIAWKYSSAHCEAEPLTLELWWSQELPNHCYRFFFFFFFKCCCLETKLSLCESPWTWWDFGRLDTWMHCIIPNTMHFKYTWDAKKWEI